MVRGWSLRSAKGEASVGGAADEGAVGDEENMSS